MHPPRGPESGRAAGNCCRDCAGRVLGRAQGFGLRVRGFVFRLSGFGVSGFRKHRQHRSLQDPKNIIWGSKIWGWSLFFEALSFWKGRGHPFREIFTLRVYMYIASVLGLLFSESHVCCYRQHKGPGTMCKMLCSPVPLSLTLSLPPPPLSLSPDCPSPSLSLSLSRPRALLLSFSLSLSLSLSVSRSLSLSRSLIDFLSLSGSLINSCFAGLL